MSEQGMYDKIKPEKVNNGPVKSKKLGGNKDNLVIIIVAAVIILAVAAIMCYYFIFRDNEVIATYDGGTVTRGEYEVYYRTFAPMLIYYGYDSDVVAKYIAEKIILDKIVCVEAEKEGVTLTDEMKAETDELLEDEDTINEFASRGIDIDDIRDVFYNDSIISAYLEKKQEEATAEDMKAYLIEEEGEDADFNIYNTEYMLFKVASDATDDERAAVKKEAEEALAKVKKGEDFATVAKEYTDDSGIEFELSDPSYVDSSFVKATRALTVGKYTTSLVESENYGYFLIKLVSIEENGRLTDETQVGYYVDSMLYAKQDEANCKYKDEKISSIATSIGTELGLISTSTEE